MFLSVRFVLNGNNYAQLYPQYTVNKTRIFHLQRLHLIGCMAFFQSRL